MSYRVEAGTQPRTSYVGRGLFWCAGADPRLMGDSRIERFRYLGVGSSVLLTACAATFAMVLFVRLSIPGPLQRDLALGAFWGLFIFTLDRWLVSSVHYGPLDQSNSGRDPGGAKRYVGALGRLIMSLFLASLISGPIVLELFAPEVNQQLSMTEDAAKSTAAASIQDRHDFAGRRAAITVALRLAEDTEKAKDAAWTSAQKAVDDEKSGRGGTHRRGCDMRPGIGACWQKTQTLASASAEARDAQSAAGAARSKANLDSAKLQRDIDDAVNSSNNVVERSGGSLARENALFQVLDAHPALWVRWALINGLFLLVDLMPVLLKIFGPATVHDRNVRLDAVRQAETADLDRVLALAVAQADHKLRREAIAAECETRLLALSADHRMRRNAIEAYQVNLSDLLPRPRQPAQALRKMPATTLIDRLGSDRPSSPQPSTQSSEARGHGLVLNERWAVERPLLEADRGGFGDIYLARDLSDRTSDQRERSER